MTMIEATRRFWPFAGGILLALLLLIALPGSCRRQRDAAAMARVEEGAARAAEASGRDAVETVDRAAARSAASAELTRTNDKEIRNAEGADAPVAAAVRDAGIDGLCRRDAYRDEPRCLRRAASGGVEGGGGGSAAAGR